MYIKFETFWKNMSLIAQVFLKLLTQKDVLSLIDKKSCFWKPFCSERVNESQIVLKSAENCFYQGFASLWEKVTSKKIFLIKFEFLGVLVNTLTTD